jgi:hypothetical protein
MRTHITTTLVATCALSACSLVGKVQTGFGGGGSTASTPGASEGGSSESANGALASNGATGGGTFCGARAYGGRTAKELHAWFDDPEEGRYELHFLIKLHQALCSSDTSAADRVEIASMRSTVLAELGLTDADTRDMPKLLDLQQTDTAPGYFEYITERPSVPGQARASSSSAVDQLYMLQSSGNAFYGTRWLVDAWSDAMTESARASYVNQCIHDLSHADPTERALGYAWCSDDAHHIDRAKLWKELAGLPPDVRFVAKLEVARLGQRIAKLDKQVASDHLTAIAIDMPRKIADDWRAFGKAHRSTIEHVRAVELAWIDNGGKAPDDCRSVLAADWKQAVSAVKVEKTVAPSLGVAQTSRAAYLASVGMVRCADKLPGYAGLAAMAGESIGRAPLGRGPRTEAFETAVRELSRKKNGDLRVPRMEAVDVSFLPIEQASDHTARFWAHTVASTKRLGDKIRFQFKKEKVDYAVCTREEPTGNWIIHDDKLEREMHCVALRSESTMESVEPLELPADLVGWVRPGNAMVIGAESFPIEIWSDVHQKRLLGLYGTKRS